MAYQHIINFIYKIRHGVLWEYISTSTAVISLPKIVKYRVCRHSFTILVMKTGFPGEVQNLIRATIISKNT